MLIGGLRRAQPVAYGVAIAENTARPVAFNVPIPGAPRRMGDFPHQGEAAAARGHEAEKTRASAMRDQGPHYRHASTLLQNPGKLQASPLARPVAPVVKRY
jgi:hypothetical protein